MKNLAFCFLFLCYGALAQSHKSKITDKTTPFDPNGNYQTFAVRLRLLPWTIGNDWGYNALGGIQTSLFKNHSFSADVMTNHSYYNVDAYYRNDSLITPDKHRSISTLEFHFAYNYHFHFESLRENSRLSFYAGINCRVGNQRLLSDTSLTISDNTIRANRLYYSFGPQVGALWNIGQSDMFSLNLNITPFYNIKRVTTTDMIGSNSYTYNNTFNTIDLKIGLNLIFWLKYCKH